MSNWIDSLGGLLSPINKIIDEFVETDEEKARAKTMLKSAMDGELKARIKDISDARAREIAVNTSPNSTWLTKNTGSLLSWVIVSATFYLDYLTITTGLDTLVVDKEILMFVLGALNAYTGSVVSFYFGSSKDHSDSLRKVRDV